MVKGAQHDQRNIFLEETTEISKEELKKEGATEAGGERKEKPEKVAEPSDEGTLFTFRMQI